MRSTRGTAAWQLHALPCRPPSPTTRKRASTNLLRDRGGHVEAGRVHGRGAQVPVLQRPRRRSLHRENAHHIVQHKEALLLGCQEKGLREPAVHALQPALGRGELGWAARRARKPAHRTCSCVAGATSACRPRPRPPPQPPAPLPIHTCSLMVPVTCSSTPLDAENCASSALSAATTALATVAMTLSWMACMACGRMWWGHSGHCPDRRCANMGSRPTAARTRQSSVPWWVGTHVQGSRGRLDGRPPVRLHVRDRERAVVLVEAVQVLGQLLQHVVVLGHKLLRDLRTYMRACETRTHGARGAVRRSVGKAHTPRPWPWPLSTQARVSMRSSRRSRSSRLTHAGLPRGCAAGGVAMVLLLVLE